jgi:SAM-dependent methyltransferase
LTDLAPDRLALQDHIISLIDLSGVQTVLDIGCGHGCDLERIGRESRGIGRLVGIDSIEKRLAVARSSAGIDERFHFLTSDVSEGLPFADGEFDIVLSSNTLECLIDKDALIREVHRVLRPGGQVIFAHWDWDSQLIDGADKDLVRKIIHTFGDWKQPWMTDCDSWMGRRLWRVFNRSNLFTGQIHPYVLVNTEYAPGFTGHSFIKDFEYLVQQNMITQEDYDRFISDVRTLADNGEYFYSMNLYTYVGRRLAAPNGT